MHPLYFQDFLTWTKDFIQKQVPELASIPIAFELLSGINDRAPEATLERELRWLTARFQSDATSLNDFRAAVAQLESLTFAGRYEDAISRLQRIDDSHGISLWSVQLRIALEHYAGGLERQKQYSANTRSVYRRGLLPFITYHTSARNEDRASLAKYADDVKVRIDKHPYFVDATKSYARFRLLAELPRSESGLADVLRIEQSHSILDIYETFIAVAQEIVRRSGFDTIKEVLRTCLASLDSLRDFRLRKCSIALGGSTNELRFDRPTEIADLLLGGKARKALLTARHVSAVDVPTDAWQFIYAGFAWSHSARTSVRRLGRPKDIARLFGEIACRRGDTNDPFAALAKLLMNIRGLPAAVGLTDALSNLGPSRPDNTWQPWQIGMNCPTFGIEDFVLRDGRAIHQLQSETTQCLSERAWSKTHAPSKNEPFDSHCSSLFIAVGFLHQRQYEHAYQMLCLHEADSLPESLRVLHSSLLLHVYFALGNRQRLVELIANEAARGAMYRRMLPVVPSMDLIAWSDYKRVESPLAVPIALHLLWTATEKDSTAAILRFSIGQLLKSVGPRLPSKLIDIRQRYPLHQLVYFLRYVCVPQFLDVSRLLKGTSEVLVERQNICATLRILDRDNSEEYEGEIASIENQLALAEGQWIVDRTRVYVDVEAFSRWATKDIAEPFARYKDLLKLRVGPVQNFDDVLRDILSSAPSMRGAFKPEGEADALLVEIVHRMTDEFLTNSAFGLDFYLSKRIRHQSFIGLIRGPLEFSHLITTRESESGSYRRNSYWLDRFSRCSPEGLRAIDAAFSRFAARVDEALIDAKDNNFQIRSSERPAGLLSIDLSHASYALTRAVAQLDITVQKFTEIVTTILWAALEASLDKVKRFIGEDLKTRVIDAVDEMRAIVRKHAEDLPEFLEFDGQIGRASVDVQRALDQGATWFTQATVEVQQQQFRLEQIVKIAIESALKCYRAFDPLITTDVTHGHLQLLGTTLVFVHDVILVALGNVRDHSGLPRPEVHIAVAPNIEEGTLTICVRSKVRTQGRATAERELAAIRDLIAAGNVGRRTRAEGGSGFLKLAADVQHSPKGKIQFGFDGEDQFTLTVVYSLLMQDGVRTANSNG